MLVAERSKTTVSIDEATQETFDFGVFLREYWRKKPLHVRGGADTILGRRWTEYDFDVALAEARAAGTNIKEVPGELLFIEHVSSFDEGMAARAAEMRTALGVSELWFDTIRTYKVSGIGAHFDHSDNFVLQQHGVKEWSIAPPDPISKADIARRMMMVPGVGFHEVPEETALHFTLEAGDVLYIPLFWLHSGVSTGDSLSVSMVCPAVSLQSAVMPLLLQVMRQRAMGYQVIPAFHPEMTPEERQATTEALAAATATLLSSLSKDEIVEAVHAVQKQRLPGLSA